MEKISSLKFAPVVTIDSSATIEHAVDLMHKHDADLLLVTEDGAAVGVLTSGAVFNQFYLHAGVHYPVVRFHGPSANKELDKQKIEIYKDRLGDFKKVTVKDLFSPRVKSVRTSQDVSDAVHLMKSLNLRRLVVVDDAGKFIGVLGRKEVLNSAFKH